MQSKKNSKQNKDFETTELKSAKKKTGPHFSDKIFAVSWKQFYHTKEWPFV